VSWRHGTTFHFRPRTVAGIAYRVSLPPPDENPGETPVPFPERVFFLALPLDNHVFVTCANGKIDDAGAREVQRVRHLGAAPMIRGALGEVGVRSRFSSLCLVAARSRSSLSAVSLPSPPFPTERPGLLDSATSKPVAQLTDLQTRNRGPRAGLKRRSGMCAAGLALR